LEIYLLTNARIYTMDPTLPTATALAVGLPSPSLPNDGRVLAVGDEDTLRGQLGGSVKTLDLGGRVVLPGLTDAHIHFKQFAQSLKKINCETPTKQACLDRIAEKVQSTAAGEWILGHGWSQNEWEGGFGTSADLDRIAPDNPVYLTAKSMHAGWANSLALKFAGIVPDLADPPGGALGRDAAGRPDGILYEGAMNLVASVVPKLTDIQLVAAMETALPHLWQLGITGIHDFDRQRCFAALQQLHSRGALRLRVTKSIPVEALEYAIGLGLRTGFGDDTLRIGSIKAFADGALGPRTAAMLLPYEGDSENVGMLLLENEQIVEFGQAAVANGLSLSVHAIGDRANHEVITAYRQIRAFEQAEGLPRLRHRIEHVQIFHPEDLPTLASLDVVASMQPIHAISDMVAADQYWGARSESSYAWRTLFDQGIRLVFGSDAPVDSPNPFWGLHAALSRRRSDGYPGEAGWHPGQRLSLQQALEAYTLGPAYQAGMEDRLGKLAPGYLADLIVLEADPHTCEPEAIRNLLPVATMIGGRWVYNTL
jgi:predicted amidohydrolase YtcJ